ncbi:uncharacterized protein BT62DRAFT_1011169 [Guyanagaster necrorhizus]|uniref:Uncharacterized protein n=1 Tax=Guyanagaster necrorhizus TaxID=856835 RepID=A0A9P7VK70_9AGAR|nr:uncharacterized protein BT62DRAFT_1011169 [Guyanagaster necrorhizus MCA 3950]KAG7441855.1 hypothetical protein BT62DRAFT_1011169 [Guyanagaster necrorhizus MCA 3950]
MGQLRHAVQAPSGLRANQICFRRGDDASHPVLSNQFVSSVLFLFAVLMASTSIAYQQLRGYLSDVNHDNDWTAVLPKTEM